MAHGAVAFLSDANLMAGASNGFVHAYVRDLTNGLIRLVSQKSNGDPSQSYNANAPAISPNGRLIAFESFSAELVTNDLNQAYDIFLRDLDAERTTLISRAAPERRPQMVVGLASVGPNSVSGDGRWVALTSTDSNLTPGDTNRWRDVFVRDLLIETNFTFAVPTNGSHSPVISSNGQYLAFIRGTGSVFSSDELVWVNLLDGTQEVLRGPPDARTSIQYPVLSPDGRLVGFQSDSFPTAPITDSNGRTDVYLWDPVGRTNQVISVNRFGTSTGNGQSTNLFFAPSGEWVLFNSNAPDLVTNRSALSGLYARHLTQSITRLVSQSNGVAIDGIVSGAVISRDSQFAAFRTTFNVAVHRTTVQSNGPAIEVCRWCQDPSISADGRFIAYEAWSYSLNLAVTNDLFVKDLQSGSTQLVTVSRAGNGGGNAPSSSPLITLDGRFVVFSSQASNLVENDTNGLSDVFVRDRVLGTTLLLSRNHAGIPGNSASSKPVLGLDGRTVLFHSFASDLVPHDFNDRRDVFILRLSAADTDGDGLDDDWEMAYFDNLNRDASGDFDQDGQSDLREFLAGTDPTDTQSILRVITISSMSGAGRTLVWSAVPGRNYRVQYESNVTDPTWRDLASKVNLNGSTGSAIDTVAGTRQRFYRVVITP